MSESIYYMDRGHGALVTDRQVMVEGRSYDLGQIRDVKIKNKPVSHAGRADMGLRVISLISLVDAVIIKGFLWGSDLAQTLLGLDMLVFTVSLVGLLFFSLAQKSHRVVVLSRRNGTTEELFECDGRPYAAEFVQAVREAEADYRAGHGANARGVYRK